MQLTNVESLSQATAPNKARILMLHGHAESGQYFHAKTRRLERFLQLAYPASPSPNSHPEFPGGVELFYPTGPVRLMPADKTRGYGVEEVNQSCPENKDLDAWAWGTGDFEKAEQINGLSQSVATTLKYMQKHGPFIGIIGFSCGATLAALLSSMLEAGRTVGEFEFPNNFHHPPLLFAVCYSGFILHFPAYNSCYQPRIRTPIIATIGRYDPMIEESQTVLLARQCENATILYHPGAHYAPMQTIFLLKVGAFIHSALGGLGNK